MSRSNQSGISIRHPALTDDPRSRARLLPAREIPLDAEAVRGFRRRYRSRFEGDVTRQGIYRGVSEGMAPPGIEFYLPLFFEAPPRSVTTCPGTW